ncbi:MAG: peptidase U32 family protein [Bacteroidota bacterium]
MAPAGSFESLNAAIIAGADSIYFGVEQLNLRARSNNNFSLQDIDLISRTCRHNNVKSHIALNTIIYDHDLRLMESIVKQAKESGIDGIIASDLSVMLFAKKIGMPIHISTQANVCNIETVEFYSNFANVIVLARELTLTQIQVIIRQIHRKKIVGPDGNLIRIEIFAHGALCMAVSGKCYLSLHSNFASANRGACIQNCRHEYIVTDKQNGFELEIDNEFIMSAKDLCTIEFMDKIMDTGVAILKIEGRGRSPEYVFTTTRCYKDAVRSVANESYHAEKISDWKEQLSKVYNRGFWDGYYLGKKLGEWSNTYGSHATERKIYIGTVSKYFKKLKVGEFKLERSSLRVGEDILIIGSKTGVVRTTVSALALNGLPATCAEVTDHFSMPVPETVRPHDKLYKVVKANGHDNLFEE